MHIKTFLFLLFVVTNNDLSSGQLLFGAINKVTKTVTNVVSDVATPVEKVVVAATLKNCDVVKALFETPIDILTGKLLEVDISNLFLDLYNQNGEIRKINLRNTQNTLLTSPHYDPSKPAVFFLHGFLKNSDSSAAKATVKSILSKWDVNVFVLDSSSILSIIYTKASECIQSVGKELGDMLSELALNGSVRPGNIHIIGHGLGAHIAGFAGKTFYERTGGIIGHITGLDPAGPCFYQEHTDLKLKETDAGFVDVIHTDSGVLGLADPIGHVDFYPNFGEKQPGCALPPCSHRRAWELYSDSVNSLQGFPAVKCVSKDTYVSGSCDKNEIAFMGFGVDKRSRGTFYLKTSGTPPFALGTNISGKNARKGILNIF